MEQSMPSENKSSIITAILLGWLLSLSPATAESFQAVVKPFIEQHCIACHGPDKQKGDLRLDQLSTDLTKLENAEEWQFVLDELNGATMPPEDEPQPEAAELTRVLESLTYSLQKAKVLHSGKNQATVIRRLNKREYRNTIHDLTGISLPHDLILPDEVESGFDTQGEELFLSAFQLEKYREWGRMAITQALAARQPIIPPTLEIRAKETAGSSLANRIDRQAKSIDKLKSTRQKAEAKQELERLRIAAKNLQSFENKKAIPIIGETEFKDFGRDALTKGQPYEASFRCKVHQLPKNKRAFLVLGNREIEVTEARDQPQEFSATINYPGGRFPKADLIITDKIETLGSAQKRPKKSRNKSQASHNSIILLETLALTGPLAGHAEASPFTRILGETKHSNESQTQYASRILRTFATRAYRGKQPSSEFIKDCLKIFQAQRSHGIPFEKAIIEPLAMILTSPEFLLLTETARTDSKTQADQRKIATRLALLLWSAPPDEELLSLAKSGRLINKLPEQVQRLLSDQRAADFALGFTKQWLDLKKLDLVEIERDKNSRSLRQWSPAIEAMLRREPAEFFLTLARENLSISNFIDSEFVVINNRLARYYGLPDKLPEDDFQKVRLPADSPRGGLLGQAAILAMTGNGKRSSPVLRGAWVMDKILGYPAPPPPPNVPELEEQKIGTVKQMLEAHQRLPQCASCHNNIDPTGFALESFDFRGQWLGTNGRELRNVLNGQLPDGTTYKNFHDYKKLLLDRREGFAKNFVEHLSSYSLGRTVNFADAAEIEAILVKSGGKDARLRDLIIAIVQSDSFLAK